jgi:hypothetical protein
LSRKGRLNQKDAIIRPNADFLAFCGAMKWEYTDVFDEGFNTRLDKLMQKSSLSNISTTILQGISDEFSFKISELLSKKSKIDQIIAQRSNVISRDISFKDIADELLEPDEIVGYYKACDIRMDNGEPFEKQVDSLLTDILSRCENVNRPVIEKMISDPKRETIVWNYLVDAFKKVNV